MARRRFSRSRRSNRGGGSRRRTTWARTLLDTGNIAPGQENTSIFDLLQTWRGDVGANLPGVTIARIRIDGACGVAPASGGVTRLAYGVTVDDNDPAPTPAQASVLSNRHRDWMHVGTCTFVHETAPLHHNMSGSNAIDVRSMRKIDRLEQTAFMTFTVPSTDVANVRFAGFVSMLLLLP